MYDDKAKIRDELIMTLTAELPVMRARLGMSQEVMASAIGVSRQTYSAIETRTKKNVMDNVYGANSCFGYE